MALRSHACICLTWGSAGLGTCRPGRAQACQREGLLLLRRALVTGEILRGVAVAALLSRLNTPTRLMCRTRCAWAKQHQQTEKLVDCSGEGGERVEQGLAEYAFVVPCASSRDLRKQHMILSEAVAV